MTICDYPQQKIFYTVHRLCWLEAISALLCGSCILLDYPYVKQRWPLTHQQQSSHRHHRIIMWTETRSQKIHFNVILFEVAGFVWHLFRIISKRLNEGAIFQPQSVCAYMFMDIPKHECICDVQYFYLKNNIHNINRKVGDCIATAHPPPPPLGGASSGNQTLVLLKNKALHIHVILSYFNRVGVYRERGTPPPTRSTPSHSTKY